MLYVCFFKIQNLRMPTSLRSRLSAARDWLLNNTITVDAVCDIIIGYAGGLIRQRTLEPPYYKVVTILELPNGLLASANEHNIAIWNVDTGECVHALRQHTANILALAVFPDGTLVSSAQDRAMIMWNTDTGEMLKQNWCMSSVRVIVAIPNSMELAYANNKDTCIYYRTFAGEPWPALKGHKKLIRDLVVLPENRLASSSDDKTVRVWSLATGNTLHVLRGHKALVRSLALLPNGHLVSGSGACELKVWDTTTGKCIRFWSYVGDAMYRPGIASLAIEADGQVIFGSKDNILTWDPTSDHVPVVLANLDFSDVRRAIVLSDGRVASCADRDIVIWE